MGLVETFAGAVDNLMQLLGQVRTFCDFPRKGKRSGVEQSPRCFITPVVRRFFESFQHVADCLHADHVLTIHVHDGMVGRGIVQGRALIGHKPLVLRDALHFQWLDDVSQQAGQITLGPYRMLAPDNMVS
jgi:hypothetical protein